MAIKARIIPHELTRAASLPSETPRWWLLRATRTKNGGRRLVALPLACQDSQAAPTLREALAGTPGRRMRPSDRDEFCLVFARRDTEADLAYWDEFNAAIRRQAS